MKTDWTRRAAMPVPHNRCTVPHVAMIWPSPDSQHAHPPSAHQPEQSYKKDPVSSITNTFDARISQTPSSQSTTASTPQPTPTQEFTYPHRSPPSPAFNYLSPPASQSSLRRDMYDDESDSAPSTLYIPSAQPRPERHCVTPPSRHVNISPHPSPLPSPPRAEDELEFARLHPSPETSLPGQYPSTPQSPTSTRRRGRRRRTLEPPEELYDPEIDPQEAELYQHVLKGIGRMHVNMRQDDAGRWRIQRHDDASRRR